MRPRKEKTRLLQKIVNVGQLMVGRHPVDNNIPQSTTQTRYINENGSTSENHDDLILGESWDIKLDTRDFHKLWSRIGESWDIKLDTRDFYKLY
jgi:hypothetical protein